MSKTYYSGFCAITPFATSAYQNQLGVLDNKGLSYSRYPQLYYKDKELLELIVFRGVEGEEQQSKIPSTHSDPVLDVLSFMLEQAMAGKFDSSSANCLQMLITQFTTGYEFTSIGTMVTNGSVYLPAHIQFTLTVNSVIHDFKIWFALENFKTEFPYRDIYVFPPVPPSEIDVLIEYNYKELQERFAKETAAKIEARVKALIGDNVIPYTWRDVISYDIYDLINKPHTTKGDWTIILWGNPNNAEDEINEAIKDCLLKNSDHSESEWEPVIPDLMNPLEFFLVPNWESVGLPNESNTGSTYSPVTQYLNADTYVQIYADFYEESFLRSSLQFVPHLWKSVVMGIVGKPLNNLGQTTFTSVFPDYQLIPSTDYQRGMMSELTEAFAVNVETLLSAAEIADENNTITASVNKVIRKDRLYVTMKVDKVKLTCITRYQYIKDGVITDE